MATGSLKLHFTLFLKIGSGYNINTISYFLHLTFSSLELFKKFIISLLEKLYLKKVATFKEDTRKVKVYGLFSYWLFFNRYE